MFITLTNTSLASSSFRALRSVDPKHLTCVHRVYVSTQTDYDRLANWHNTCSARNKKCLVQVHLAIGARMWGDLALEDVAKDTRVVFLRAGKPITTRALDWIILAHQGIQQHYDEGGRREYVGAAVGCEGEKSLTPWWSHIVGPIDNTCVWSPLRTGEDLWAFFARWYQARRREWVSWPHVWEEDDAVGVFWKSTNKNTRDERLISFGERVGTNYGWIGDAEQLWERWYPRWAANYSMKVITAESPMGVDDGTLGIGKNSLEDSVKDTSDKMLKTESGDIVHVGSVWYAPADAEFGQGYFDALQKIVQSKASMVSLTLVSAEFVELTRSWLCNVQGAGFLPENIFWIVLDEKAKTALDGLAVGQTVDITDVLAGENMDAAHIIYGQPAYWRLMLMRTRLIKDLLDRGIDLFLFETDQVWLQNPFDFFKKELDAGADMVGTLDTQHNVAGNTLLLRSVISTRRMWSEVYKRFKMSYDDKEIEHKPIHSSTFVFHDQHQLSALLLFDTAFTQDYPVALALMNFDKFVGGSWYSGKYTNEASKKPVIINNNFISGTAKKKSRAITFGHWFLKDDGVTCDRAAIKKALRYEFDKLPGKWWAEEQKKMGADRKKRNKSPGPVLQP